MFDERWTMSGCFDVTNFSLSGLVAPPQPLLRRVGFVAGRLFPLRKLLPFRMHLVQRNNTDSRGGRWL